MKKLFFLFVGIFLLLWLLSFFLPAQFYDKIEQNLSNNQSIIWNELSSPDSLVEWLPFIPNKSQTEVSQNTLRWHFQDKQYSLTIDKTVKDTIHYTISDEEATFLLFLQFVLKASSEKNTKIISIATSSPTINIKKRYEYWFEKEQLKKEHQQFINALKQHVKHIPYERFSLSPVVSEYLNQTVLALPKIATPQQLSIKKHQAIDSLLLQRLVRYRLLDTTKRHFIEYTRWTDTLISYNICLPLVRIPTEKQAYYLQPNGKVKNISGKYIKAKFYGFPPDLSLAWNKLYQQTTLQNNIPNGFPLEKLITSTDSLGKEYRELYIQVEDSH